MVEEAVIDQKGRVVIPKEIRTELGLKEGEKVRLTKKEDGVFLTRPVTPDSLIQEMEGCLQEDSSLPKVDPLKLKRIWEKP
ncbi:MAG: AbrB/MazE/SpoVT family DNA-binding domain-containing protein [Thermoproteota archaeon]